MNLKVISKIDKVESKTDKMLSILLARFENHAETISKIVPGNLN